MEAMDFLIILLVLSVNCKSDKKSNTEVKEIVGTKETINLILDHMRSAVPGYPELADEMIALNVDRKETAFIVAVPLVASQEFPPPPLSTKVEVLFSEVLAALMHDKLALTVVSVLSITNCSPTGSIFVCVRANCELFISTL